MKSIYHKHHIIPKHNGGTNDDWNIALLTPEEHAEAHHILYLLYGRWQDKACYPGLYGWANHSDTIKSVIYAATKIQGDQLRGKPLPESTRLKMKGRIPWNKGKKTGPLPEHVILKLKGKKPPIAGKTHTPEARAKIKAKRALQVINFQKITCPHCGKCGGANVMPRWHFENCKLRFPDTNKT